MHTLAKYVNSYRHNGQTIISFAIDDDIEKLEKLKEEICVLDIKKFNSKRSLNANAYFWHLVGELGKKLRVDKYTAYLWQLSRWGVWQDAEILTEAYPVFKNSFRMCEILQENENTMTVRCYIGSSQYNKEQMHDLMEGTLQDCEDMQIETWTREEIENVLNLWEGVY